MSAPEGIAARAHARNSVLLMLLHHFIYDVRDGANVEEILREIVSDPVSRREEDTGKLLEPFLRLVRKLLESGDAILGFTIANQSWKMGYDRDGLNASTFYDPASGEVYFTFRGTGDGEWNDNGAALCGIKQPNVYYSYNDRDEAVSAEIREDLLSTQQAQTLDYIERAMRRSGWQKCRDLIVAGHSKGGNKTQLAVMMREEFSEGYSFNGQGFSPEAVAWFKELYSDYDARAAKIYSLCCCDDFVSGLGDPLYPPQNLETLAANREKTMRSCHELYTIISDNLELNGPAPRSKLGMSTVRLWEQMRSSPDRSLAAMGLMSTCEKHLGGGLPVNGEYVSGGVEAVGGLISAGVYIKANAETVKPLARAVNGAAEFFDKAGAAIEQLGLGADKLRAFLEASLGSSPHPATSLESAALRERALALDAASFALAESAEKLGAVRQDAADRKAALTLAARLKMVSAAVRAALHDFETADRELARLARLSLARRSAPQPEGAIDAIAAPQQPGASAADGGIIQGDAVIARREAAGAAGTAAREADDMKNALNALMDGAGEDSLMSELSRSSSALRRLALKLEKRATEKKKAEKK